ncbi:MAG: alpha-1,2-fucosyltransferase, partial [Bacteroidia bacterium]
YELDQFKIASKIAGKEELKKFSPNGIIARIFGKDLIYHETKNSYNKEFENIGSDSYIDGFWQSEKYFASIKNILLNEFTPSYELSSEEKKLVSEISSCNSVGIHVRRGDYVHLKSASEYHGTCSMDYYNVAIEYLNKKTMSPFFFIFSDDLAWCRENFKHIANVSFVDVKNAHSGLDLYLMSCCKHNIIVNSSYSWWAAWLNRNEDKIVIAPKNWFAAGVSQNEDLLPATYIKL